MHGCRNLTPRGLLFPLSVFCQAPVLASVGHFVQEAALYWIAYEITGSAMALGILGLCEAPRALLGWVMSVFNVDQGMRSVGSMVIDAYLRAFLSLAGAAARKTDWLLKVALNYLKAMPFCVIFP